MKKQVPVLFLILFLFSCREKENVSFISEYQDIVGVWNTRSVSWDSSGVRISCLLPYDRLIISDNLSYVICLDKFIPVENGTVNIIDQTSSKLELFFDPDYPLSSSFAGSHIFGFSNVVLEYLSKDEVVFKSVDPGFFPGMEYRFGK